MLMMFFVSFFVVMVMMVVMVMSIFVVFMVMMVMLMIITSWRFTAARTGICLAPFCLTTSDRSPLASSRMVFFFFWMGMDCSPNHYIFGLHVVTNNSVMYFFVISFIPIWSLHLCVSTRLSFVSLAQSDFLRSQSLHPVELFFHIVGFRP